MWTIAVDYTTGDSFHTEEVYGEEVGHCWTNKKDAIAALQCIAEQSEYNSLIGRHYYGNLNESEQKDRIQELKERDWFNEEWGHVSIFIRDNDGKRMRMSAFWDGYFETLHEAKVIAAKPDEDECVFRPG